MIEPLLIPVTANVVIFMGAGMVAVYVVEHLL